MKRIIICCDGTSKDDNANSADDTNAPSNIVLLSRAIVMVSSTAIPQIVYYQPGVGSADAGLLSRLAQSALGISLGYKVRSAYSFIVHNYEPGDEIFLFGFSRGGFTARSVAGFIEWAGVLRKTQMYMKDFDKLWEAYKKKENVPNDQDRFDALKGLKYQNRYTNVYIKCVGVFDTVAALGIPSFTPIDDDFDKLARSAAEAQSFYDVDLGEHVDYAFQALALDEHRRDFYPAIWKVIKPQHYQVRDKDGKPDQVVYQTWFAGAHSDIGGGYPEHGLSDVSLAWMISKLVRHGLLDFDMEYLREIFAENRPKEQWAFSPHDSAYGFSGFPRLRYVDRKPGAFPPAPLSPPPTHPDDDFTSIQTIHKSVLERVRKEEETGVPVGERYLDSCSALKKWGYGEAWIEENLEAPDTKSLPEGVEWLDRKLW
ncbi:hypothetical protein YB2330_003196 [Saitoella coloradoensis]